MRRNRWKLIEPYHNFDCIALPRTFLTPGGPDELCNVRDHILTQAWNKFLVKVLNIVYRWGGEVVYDGDTPGKRLKRCS